MFQTVASMHINLKGKTKYIRTNCNDYNMIHDSDISDNNYILNNLQKTRTGYRDKNEIFNVELYTASRRPAVIKNH